MMKVVMKLDLHDDRGKQKAMKAVSSLQGIESISMDMKDKKLTVIGDADPVGVVVKVRKHWPNADIVTVGPAKEEKAPPPTKPNGPSGQIAEMVQWHNGYGYGYGYPASAYTHGSNYRVYSVEDNPNSCVIS